MGSTGFFASSVFSFFGVLDVGKGGDFLFFEAIFVQVVTFFSWIELVTLPFNYTPCIWLTWMSKRVRAGLVAMLIE